MGRVRKDNAEDYRLPKRPINEMFLSLNGNPEDYAFRGIKDSWKEFVEDGKDFYKKIKKGG